MPGGLCTASTLPSGEALMTYGCRCGRCCAAGGDAAVEACRACIAARFTCALHCTNGDAGSTPRFRPSVCRSTSNSFDPSCHSSSAVINAHEFDRGARWRRRAVRLWSRPASNCAHRRCLPETVLLTPETQHANINRRMAVAHTTTRQRQCTHTHTTLFARVCPRTSKTSQPA
jgi:hypothetical protein